MFGGETASSPNFDDFVYPSAEDLVSIVGEEFYQDKPNEQPAEIDPVGGDRTDDSDVDNQIGDYSSDEDQQDDQQPLKNSGQSYQLRPREYVKVSRRFSQTVEVSEPTTLIKP